MHVAVKRRLTRLGFSFSWPLSAVLNVRLGFIPRRLRAYTPPFLNTHLFLVMTHHALKIFLVLGYLIACLGPFKVLEMKEFVLKITCFHISWLIHFILLYCLVVSVLCCLCLLMTSFMSIVQIVDLKNVKIYVCMYVCMYVCKRNRPVFPLPQAGARIVWSVLPPITNGHVSPSVCIVVVCAGVCVTGVMSGTRIIIMVGTFEAVPGRPYVGQRVLCVVARTALFGPSRENHRGYIVKGQWVFGGMESESVQTFLGTAHDWTADSLVGVIKEWTMTGATILMTHVKHIAV
jgi:hypothetical protein